MFGCSEFFAEFLIVPAEVSGCGVDVPLLFCVAATEAWLLEASDIICFKFLFLRMAGLQVAFRKGLRTP